MTILPPLDIRRFDLRVARVHHILEHPKINSRLYIQNMVYSKEEDPVFKLAINNVARYYSEEEMDDKMVVMLCNPKPIVVKGIISRAKMMCASSYNRLELLIPPPGSVEGDEVTLEGYPRDPERPFLLPVENAFDAVCADLKVNCNKQAVYRGIPLKVEGKGFLTTNKLSDCPIIFK